MKRCLSDNKWAFLAIRRHHETGVNVVIFTVFQYESVVVKRKNVGSSVAVWVTSCHGHTFFLLLDRVKIPNDLFPLILQCLCVQRE